jgi:hypothetical protein
MTEQKSVTDRLVELFVYAPVGIALSVAEEFPSLVAKGRSRVDSQVALARMVGRFAVAEGRRQAESRLATALARLRPSGGPQAGPPAPATTRTAPAGDGSEGDGARATAVQGAPTSPAPEAEAGGPADEEQDPPAATAARPDAAHLPIPDYDALSASQVVRRLAALSGDELEAVRAYEVATRGRRTVLARIAQLEQES